MAKILEGISLIPGINICWYQWNGKRHYYVVFYWLFWYWTSLKEFEWDKEGGGE